MGGFIPKGGAGLTAAQQAAVDSITGLPADRVPKSDGTKFVASGATVSPTTGEWTFDETVNIPTSSLNLGGAWTLSSSGQNVALRNQATGDARHALWQSYEDNDAASVRTRTVQPEITVSDKSATLTNPAWNNGAGASSNQTVKQVVFDFVESVGNLRLRVELDGTVFFDDTFGAIATGEQALIPRVPVDVNQGQLVTFIMSDKAGGDVKVKGSTTITDTLSRPIPYQRATIATWTEEPVATTSGTTNGKLPKMNGRKLEDSSLSESANEVSSAKAFRAKTFKTKNRSIEIGPNFSVGNSSDELEFTTLNTGVTRTTGHTTYTDTGGTVNDEHFRSRRVWETDNAVIQSDSSENSADFIGTGANTVTGEYRAIINTAHVAFPPKVQHYFVRMAADSIGARLQVYQGTSLTSPLIYQSSDDFDFDDNIGARSRVYEQALTGTISVTSGSPTVTGVGTAFDTELQKDDIIKLPNQSNIEYVVKSVESATSLTLEAIQGRPLPVITASGETFQRGHSLLRTPGGFTFQPSTTYLVRVQNKANNINIQGKVGAIGQTGQFVFYFERVWQDTEFPEIPTAAHNHIKHLTQVYAGMGSIAQGGTTVTATDSNFTTDFQVDDCFDLNGQTFTIKSIESDTGLTTNETATNATSNIGIYRHGDYIKWLDDASREIFKVTQQNHFIMDRNLTVKGDLNVEGSTNTISSETLNVANNHIFINDGYTVNTAKTGGLVANYHPTTTQTTMSSGTFTAGVASTSNPTVVTVGSGTFAASDLVLISGTSNNDGLFEVLSHTGTTLTIRGVGTVATVEDFTKNQFAAGVGNGAITKVNVSVIRAGADGKWEQGKGNATGIAFTNLADELVTFTEGSVPFSNASGVLTQDAANLFWKDDTNRLGVATNDPKATLHAKGSVLLGERYTASETTASIPSNFTGIVSPTNRTGTQTGTESAVRLIRDGQAGTKYNMVADFEVGTYSTGISSQSELKLRLNNGNTHTPDTDIASFRADGRVNFNGRVFADGVLGVDTTDGADNQRLRVTASDTDTFDNSRGASIDLHGNEHASAGRLDLVGGGTGDVTFWTNNAQRASIDGTSGYLKLGSNTPPNVALDIAGESTAASSLNFNTYSNDNGVGQLSSIKHRGSEFAPFAIQTGDFIMDWRMGGRDNVDVGLGLQLYSQATENWTNTARGSEFFIASSKNGTVTTDNALKIDSVNNAIIYEKLGVGTTNPDAQAKVHIDGGATGALRVSGSSQGRMLLEHSGATANQRLKEIQSLSGDIQFSTIDDAQATRTTHMTITNGSFVGIGTSSPNAPLQFQSALRNRDIVMWETANNDHQYYGFGINGSTLRYQIDNPTAAHRFYAGTGATTSTELASINGDGTLRVNALAAGRVESSAAGVMSSVPVAFIKANQTGSAVALTSGVWVDIPGCEITVNVSGTYCIQYVGRAFAEKDDYVTFRIYDVTGATSLSVTEGLVGPTASNLQGTTSCVTFENVTGSRTYRLQARASDINATSSDDTNGRTYIAAHRI